MNRYLNSRPVKRTINWHGVPISVEFDIGDTKRGIGDYGEVWTNTYEVPYGEFPTSKTMADRSGVDCYVGPNAASEMVFVVHQLKRDGTYDEPKVMVNFTSREEAIRTYSLHGPSERLGPVDEMTVDQFTRGFLASNRKIP